MKLQELYDYDGKSASKLNPRKKFGPYTMKVKKLFFAVGFILICLGYVVERKNVNHKMTK